MNFTPANPPFSTNDEASHAQQEDAPSRAAQGQAEAPQAPVPDPDGETIVLTFIDLLGGGVEVRTGPDVERLRKRAEEDRDTPAMKLVARALRAVSMEGQRVSQAREALIAALAAALVGDKPANEDQAAPADADAKGEAKAEAAAAGASLLN